MKFDFYTGARDMTGVGSDFGYGVGVGFNYNGLLTYHVCEGSIQGSADGRCDMDGTMKEQ